MLQKSRLQCFPSFCSSMEGVASKLPSSLKLINPNFPLPRNTRLKSKFRSKFSCSAAASIDTETPQSISLGHVTRPDFPILHQTVNKSKLVYLDNAATSQKPSAVLDILQNYYETYNSNVHRGIHFLSARATDEYELARKKVAGFINASKSSEIVFTRNATEAINLVAYSWGLSNLKSGDEIILTVAEHHSAIVPWQMVAQKTGAILKFVNLTTEEIPDINELKELLSEKTKLVVTHHVSNTLGCVLPIKDITRWSHNVGAKVLVDACQSVPHMVVDVQNLDADFLVASSHKMCGPTGVGFLYGKSEILSEMPPFLGGGEMISEVFLDHSTFAEPPSRFEAGTPAIGEAIGLGAAIDYMSRIGMDKIHEYEVELSTYLYESLRSIPKVRIYGPAPSKTVTRAALCSFNVENIHPTDIATFLDQEYGVAVRSGHHCTQPLHRYLGINASARASLHFYNTKEDVDAFIAALTGTIDFFNFFGVWAKSEEKDDKEPPKEEKKKRKQSLFGSVTEALDFSQVRSAEDAQLIEEARETTGSGGRMNQQQYGALRRKIGGTYKDFFKSFVDVDGEYVEEGWVDKTCKVCKKDTRNDPRQVDNLGRYVHIACLEKSKSGNFFTRLFSR